MTAPQTPGPASPPAGPGPRVPAAPGNSDAAAGDPANDECAECFVPLPPGTDRFLTPGDVPLCVPCATDEPSQRYPWGRVGLNDDGTLDEIVVADGVAHLEQTSPGSWCLSITRDDLAVTIWLSTPHGEDGQAASVTARWEIGPGAGGTTNVPAAPDGTTNGPGGA